MLGCVLVALAALVAFAPAASAQTPAETEYDLGPLPGADDGGAAAPQSGDGVPVGAGSGDGGGGGGPLMLIVLAAVAAVCTGLAVWRLRDGGSDDEPPAAGSGPGPSTGERQSA